MPSNDIPAMPAPNAGAGKPVRDRTKLLPPVEDDAPVRLEPAIDVLPKVELPMEAPDTTLAAPRQEPGSSSVVFTKQSTTPSLPPGCPTQLRPRQTDADRDEESTAPITEPITSETSWSEAVLRQDSNTNKLTRLAVPAAMVLAVGLIGLIIWSLAINGTPTSTHDQAATAASHGAKAKPEWEMEARNVLDKYLRAEGDTNQQLLYVTPTRETHALLPEYQPPRNAYDVVQATAFVVKPLPKSFTDNGIYLMYYQRPDTPPEDAVFRPLMPIRVQLALDSPSFLELAAQSGRLRAGNQQNICAFFKRGNDDRITLDWPVFVQTRHRLLSRFIDSPHTESHGVFRLMVYPVLPSLVKNVYAPHLRNHDWYRIHCPGYDRETHVVAVARDSAAGKILRHRFGQDAPGGRAVHAITAELVWRVSEKDASPVLAVSGIVSWEFYNLNSPEQSQPTMRRPGTSRKNI
ncbi:MAG: hypothetical protein H7A51_12780 [Akkermansiaceae bacterium]|nr:hypothetical protein [Akkermansiaceae bacterium]